MSIADLPRPIGYVLGGGGSLGAVQVGMLQALGEHDVAPAIVAGTSHPGHRGRPGGLPGRVLAVVRPLRRITGALRDSHWHTGPAVTATQR